jgi:hypothetical protein
LNARAVITPAATLRVFGRSLEAQPKSAACQQGEAENHVAGGGIDGFRRKVNVAHNAAAMRHIALYELVMASFYSLAALWENINRL